MVLATQNLPQNLKSAVERLGLEKVCLARVRASQSTFILESV